MFYILGLDVVGKMILLYWIKFGEVIDVVFFIGKVDVLNDYCVFIKKICNFGILIV